jgi:transposase
MADGIVGSRKAYGTDLSDAQWAIMEPLLPAEKPGGRPRVVDLREVIRADSGFVFSQEIGTLISTDKH